MEEGARPLGILAGNGALPLEVADCVSAGGRSVHLVAIRGEADAGVSRHPHTWIELGQVGAMLRALRSAGCRELVILGGVRRPDLGAVRVDAGFFLNLPLIIKLMAGGDDSVLRRVVSFFERRGFRVLGAHEVAPGLLAGRGALGGCAPRPGHLAEIARGLSLIAALAPADVGQAVVIADGRPVAIEAAEGTDAMLERLSKLRAAGLGGAGGVLVKAAKPGQELRVDLPAIGPRTVMSAAAAGLDGIAVAAGQVLIAECATARKLAEERCVFLFGADPLGIQLRRGLEPDGEGLSALYGRPRRRERRDARRALAAISAAAAFGAGETVVTARRHILAVESGEGARTAIERVVALRQWGDQRARRRRGVAALRPGVDEPEGLVSLAAAAGLAGIALPVGWRGDERLGAVEQAAHREGLFVLMENGAREHAHGQAVGVFLVAGEHSGDALGGGLMAALRARLGTEVAFGGVGGERMREQGLVSLFPLSDVAVMGPLSILRRLPRIVRRVHQAVDAALAQGPDVVVIIDSPELTHAIARRIRRRAPHIPIIDFVSPSVWAWRPGRAVRMRRFVDHVLALLPFEPEAHRRLGGPPCTYVGHPLIERLDWLGGLDPGPLANRLGLAAEERVLLVLPGSRASEVGRLMEPFGEAVRLLASQGLTPRVIIPALAHVRPQIEAALTCWPVRPVLIEGDEDKFRAFKLADAALAASGTVTLELALARTPTVVAYRVDALAARLRFLVKVPSVVLANLVLGEQVYPELIQEDCTPGRLAAALTPLLGDTSERRRQLAALARTADRLRTGRGSPSDAAAEIVLHHVRRAVSPPRK